MSTNAVIVALPEQDDRVNKLSSEKQAHLTLLFLGDVDKIADLEGIVQFVEHAVEVSEHGQFMLDVDHRGELGPDQADVLFFRKDYSYKWINSFRSQLLQNGSIRAAYDSVEQYDEWTPHLTMGYPEAPAKEDDREHGIGWVSFDRIAVWTGDFGGPEFRLQWPERYMEIDSAGWSDADMARAIAANEALAHHGVKGMRWGHRKTETITKSDGSTKQVTPKKAAKADKAWQKNIYSINGAVAVHNAAADHFNSRIGAINDKHADVTFTSAHWDDHTRASWSPAQKAYMKEVDDMSLTGVRKAVEKVHGKSPSGKLSARLNDEGTGIVVEQAKAEAKHADGNSDEIVAVLTITKNAKGLITKAESLPEKDPMQHTIDLGAEFLAHHGVKGMKWGVRKDNSLSAHKAREAARRENRAPQEVAVSDTIGKTKLSKTTIKTKGGQDHPAAADAIKVATAQQKMKKSGTAALSNKELKDMAERLRLETEVARLSKEQQRTHQGRAFVKKLTGYNKDFNDTVGTAQQTKRLLGNGK